MWWLFPPTPDSMDRILNNGEPVFDVRDLPDEGGGIKVIQEVRSRYHCLVIVAEEGLRMCG